VQQGELNLVIDYPSLHLERVEDLCGLFRVYPSRRLAGPGVGGLVGPGRLGGAPGINKEISPM
jgi:hypothetical protein